MLLAAAADLWNVEADETCEEELVLAGPKHALLALVWRLACSGPATSARATEGACMALALGQGPCKP